MIQIPDRIKNLTTYKAGKPIDELAREKGLKKIVKLASNENPLGPSPKAAEAIISHVQNLHRYGDPTGFDAVNSLSKKYNKPFESIFIASGSDAILQYIIMALTNENDQMLSSRGSFIGWYVNSDKLGRKNTSIPLTADYEIDLQGIKQNITNNTKIIYLANPNNPTGTFFSKIQFEVFMDDVPRDTVVILDEAYTLYAEDHHNYPNGLDYDYPNLLVLRTFSKSYGLAGLRMGFACGYPELISALKKARMPFEPNTLATYAAIAALNDEDFLERTVQLNRVSMQMFREAFDEFRIKYTKTASNFFLLIFNSPEKAIRFNQECLERGLILRYVDYFGIPNGVRINSGTVEETEFAIEIIKEVTRIINPA
ncbi:MAG: histidinol-phosphate transaminase [Ignavibacteriaceae bacterium]